MMAKLSLVSSCEYRALYIFIYSRTRRACGIDKNKNVLQMRHEIPVFVHQIP
jgi:hypothetical protein